MLGDAGVHERNGDAAPSRAAPSLIRVNDLDAGTRPRLTALEVILLAARLHGGIRREVGDTRVVLEGAECFRGKPGGDEIELVERGDIGRSVRRRLRRYRAGGAMRDLNECVVAGGEVGIGRGGRPVRARRRRDERCRRKEGRRKAPCGITRLPLHFPRYSQPEYYLPTQKRSSPVRVMFVKARTAQWFG